MSLVELVYEGGEVIDRALAEQRKLLVAELGGYFSTLDLRGLPQTKRATLLGKLSVPIGSTLLVRGLSGVHEAAARYPSASLLMDALGRSETPSPRELSRYAFKTRRVFVYGEGMADAVRVSGIGAVSVHAGPYFPRVNLEPDVPPEKGTFVVGVLELGDGALDVIVKLRKLRIDKGVSFQIVSTCKAADVVVPDVLEVARQAELLISPAEGMDRLGPDEGAILALCTGRALCSVHGDAFGNLPYQDGKYLHATRYSPGSYANAVLEFKSKRDELTSWARSRTLPCDTVPKEILRRY